jgi:tetratricopeptide (TPR) repeat protein
MERAARGLVGRQAELAAVSRALCLGRATANGSIAAVVGEPGIGKTRLLQEVCSLARAERRLVLEGRSAEFAQDDAFGLPLDALDDHLGSLDRRALDTLGPERKAELAMVFPSLAAHADPRRPTLQEERHRSHRAVRAVLELLAARRPLLLVLDDVHWADDASLELISHLVRRKPRGAVAIALGFRPRQAPERLRVAIAAGERDSGLVRVELEPLSRTATDELLSPGFRPGERAALHRESGGNPFYLEELSRALLASPRAGTAAAPATDSAALAEVPETVRTALARELAGLSDAAAALVHGAAIVGEPFTPELAAEAAGVEPERAFDALDEALAADVVRPTDAPRQFRFRHPLVRRAVYESLGPGWRLAAHRRAAAALARRGASPAMRARHVECSAEPGDDEAIAVLAEAAGNAAPRAPASAAHWYRAALDLMGGDDPRRLELLVPMATALGAAGRLVESRDALRETIAALPPELAALRVQVLPFIGLLEHLLGNHHVVAPLLRRALEELPDPRSREAAILRIELASDRFYMNDSPALHALSGQAHAAAVACGDRALIVAASGLAAVGAYKVGRIAEAEERFAEGVRLAQQIDDLELAPYLLAFFWLGWYGQCAERYRESLDALDRGMRVARATGQGHLYVPMLVATGILLTWLGRLHEATEIADEAIDAARLSLNDQFLGWSLTLGCWIATLAGDTATALALGREAIEASSRVSEHYFSKLAGCYLADACSRRASRWPAASSSSPP